MLAQVLEVVVCGALFMAAFAATVGVVALGIRVLGRVVEWMMGKNRKEENEWVDDYFDFDDDKGLGVPGGVCDGEEDWWI